MKSLKAPAKKNYIRYTWLDILADLLIFGRSSYTHTSFFVRFQKKLKAHFAQKTQTIGGYSRFYKKTLKDFYV